jgi:serine/threonine-protein kinase
MATSVGPALASIPNASAPVASDPALLAFSPNAAGAFSTGRLGRYQLSLELARGGMATVHLARVEGRAGVHRFVAVKVLHAHLTQDPEFIEMFLDEARIASRVQHANLCGVIDFEASASGHYLVMEYLAGEPLSTVFRAMGRRAKGSPVERAARVARVIADACEGLHAAHELTGDDGEPLGVVHRDISPENVFLTYDGVAKVVDFGVATAATQRHHTRTGVLKGKFAYMAPEVLRGRRPDRRADIWSMGVVLWELLTLKRLFHRASDVSTLKSVSELKVPPPSQVRAGLPPYYDEIVLKALARDPQHRYQSARELGRDLTHVLARRRIAVSLAELSEWMDELFPSGRACKRQLLEIASRIEEATCVREAQTLARRSSGAFYEAKTRIHGELTSPRRSNPPNRVSLPPLPTPLRRTAPAARRLRGRGAFTGVAAATLTLGAGLALLQPFSSDGDVVHAAPAVEHARPAPPPAAPATASAAPLRVGGAPYVVELERQVASDPSSIVLRIRPDNAATPSARESASADEPVEGTRPAVAPVPRARVIKPAATHAPPASPASAALLRPRKI